MTNKPYVFVSYAHLDNSIVLPCVNAMKQSGINLWYDEGIEAGSEWPEFIAEKVVDCTKFVLFVSKAYLNSQNCKRELNFAISRKKEILSIFIEDVDLSPGMEMQLGTYQAIYRKRFDNIYAFHNSICGESFFNICRLDRAESAAAPKQESAAPQNSATPPHTTQPVQETPPPYTPYTPQSAAPSVLPLRNRYVAALLAIFLGMFGVHKFYLKQPKRGILYFVFCWTYVPMVISFVDGLMMLFTSDEKFEKKYKCRTK